ncbi:MAG: acyltransferase family protein, partial [Verrucomicrobiales bacterium]
MSYRPEIDGLRAIAVLAVVLYHAGLGCSGGFVGVDVFFVISGYLITSLILKDIERGTYSLAEFWERRSRRIIPALFVVILATLLAGGGILLPADYSDLGESAIAQTFFGANIHFWLDSGYFAEPSAEKPLLHTWSLAVEEQFYLLVPLVFWGILRNSGTRSKNRALILFFFAFLLSFALSVVRVRTNPSSTFFLLPTRAWELLMGSVLAMLPAGAMRAPHWIRETICALGIGLILWSVFAYTESTLFPGISALPPCLGAAFVIWSNTGTTTRCSSILRTRPVVFVGLISYSLYLWHWPLFAYATYWFGSHVPLSVRLSLLLAGFVLAILSWRYVETPFRARKVCGTRRGIFTFAGCSLLCMCSVGLVVQVNAGFPARLSLEALCFAEG